ncbi:Actin-fragmin kinase (AFK) [Durusdinium trenchii]|uniref:Actin-fragmin kinase (AFK) n=1 Tax=Durusdinium trenchii TaxID=1381693 RepID=A0ABP0L6A1_9DINO
MALLIAAAFLIAPAFASWSTTSYSSGNFRVQTPASTLGDGELWTFGGRGLDTSVASPPFDYIDQIWAYNLSSDEWRNVSAVASGAAPSPRSECSAVYIGTNVWIYGGGAPPNTETGDLFTFDTSSNTWAQITPTGGPPPGRRAHAALTDGAGQMWVVGGYYSGATQVDTWIYNIAGNSWSQAADGPASLMYHSAVYEPGGGKIWLFGGVGTDSGGWHSSRELWCLDITANTWSNFTQPDGPAGRRSHVAVLAESQGTRGTMWIHGGYLYDGAEVTKYSDVWSYEIAGDTWTEVATGPSSMTRYMHTAVLGPGDVMWIYGGTYSSVVDTVHAFFTLPTTTTSTTTTTGMSDVTPVNASQALTMVEDRQDAMSAAVQANLGNVSADGFTLSEQEDLTLNGTAIQSKALMASNDGFSYSYRDVTVELSGALLQTLQDGFALSLALISSDSSSFALFEEPPAVLTSPIVSVQLYTSTGGKISQLASPLLITFPRPTLEGRFRPQCVFWDEALQAWSTNGVTLVSQSAAQVTCAAEHLSLFALLLIPFLCSNAAAIFSQAGLEALAEFSWAGRLPAVVTWLTLLVGGGLLVAAFLMDRRHQTHRKQLLKRLETCEQVTYTKKRSMELPKEKLEIHPKTVKKILLKHLHTQILLSELGVDLGFLKQLYVTGGFSPVHAQAKELVEKFYASSILSRSILLFRVHCQWMKFSYPMMRTTSVQRCAETLAKFWSGLALVAMWYSSTALAAHQPADCDVVKGLAQMIVRGFVVSTVGAIIGILPVLATIIIQQKLVRKMGQTARVFFWSFIALYFLLSLFVVLVFLASVSDVDGIDFLIGVLTAVARTILLTPWVGVTFFLLFIACVEVDLASSLPFERTDAKSGQSLRVDVQSLAVRSPSNPGERRLCFKCQVSGLSEVITVKQQDAELAPGVCFTGLAQHHVILLSVYETKEKTKPLSLLGATAVLVSELKSSQELPLQCRGKALEDSLLLSVKLSEMEVMEFPALLESPGESYGKLGEEGAAKVKEGTQVQPHVDVQVVTFQSEASDDDLQQETI